MIKKIFLLFWLMLLLPVSASAEFKGLHPPMEIEPELLGPPMVYIKGGCFEMGDRFWDGLAVEVPVHTVCVDDFYIGKYEVTQREWLAVMGSNPSYVKGCDNCPVDSVSWDDVQGFIIKLNSKTGKNYRLPTEAEWEYAAISGGKKERFAGFSDENQLYLYANFCDTNCEILSMGFVVGQMTKKLDALFGTSNYETSQKAYYEKNWKIKIQNDRYKYTSPVGSYRPNGLGLYDMTGNVWEWVSDWYDEVYYKTSPKDNPKGPSSGKLHMHRGGSFGDMPEVLLASVRGHEYVPSMDSIGIGFRLALSPK